MNEFLEIAKYTIPSLIVLIIAYFMLKAFVESNHQNFELIEKLFIKQTKEMAQTHKEEPSRKTVESHAEFNRLQLQAYERLTLFLERINPPNLVPRILPGNETSLQLQKALHHAIREEYEHNLSQQVFLNQTSWELVKAAKENVVQLINASAQKMDKKESAASLAAKILTHGFDKGKDPVENALTALKSDLQKKYNVL